MENWDAVIAYWQRKLNAQEISENRLAKLASNAAGHLIRRYPIQQFLAGRRTKAALKIAPVLMSLMEGRTTSAASSELPASPHLLVLIKACLDHIQVVRYSDLPFEHPIVRSSISLANLVNTVSSASGAADLGPRGRGVAPESGPTEGQSLKPLLHSKT